MAERTCISLKNFQLIASNLTLRSRPSNLPVDHALQQFGAFVYSFPTFAFTIGFASHDPCHDLLQVSLMWLALVAMYIGSTVGDSALQARDPKRLRRVQLLVLCGILLQTVVCWLMLVNPHYLKMVMALNDMDRFIFEARVLIAIVNVIYELQLLRIIFVLASA